MQKDIIIIGGGPAGLSTALHLHRIAPHLLSRALILEKAHYPRPKLCAGGLVADAEVILSELGLDVTEIPHVDAGAAHFFFQGGGLTIRQPKAHALRIIRREEFDAWLAEKTRLTGIEIHQGITVTAIHPQNDHVAVETSEGTYYARMVLGADGSNGIVRRCIFPQEPVHTARLLEVLAPQLEENTTHPTPPQAYFDFSPIPEGISGYVWNFPALVNGQFMRCWGIYDANMVDHNRRGNLKNSLSKDMSKAGWNLKELTLKGHPLHWYHPNTKLSIPRVLLAGDSAGADPIFGEGISIALGYGKIAAREIALAFEKGDFSLTNYTTRIHSSPLGKTLHARWLIARVIYFFKYRWFHFLLWRVFKPVVLLVAWIFVLNWAAKHE